MARAYVRKPCQRCGGDKGPRPPQTNSRYCPPCQGPARQERWGKTFGWWCGECDSPHYCEKCTANKRARILAAARNRKHPSGNFYRPFNAERWWQQRSHSLVQQAIKRGLLPDLKSGDYACADCGDVAHEYDHRDYGRPFDVDPVCRRCNKRRGTAIWPTGDRFQFAQLTQKARRRA